MNESRIRAVVFKEGNWWILQLLEYDLATQVRHLEDFPSELGRLLFGQMEANAACGVEPFHGFSRAPKRYWEMYEAAQPWTEPLPSIALPEDLGSTPAVEARVAS